MSTAVEPAGAEPETFGSADGVPTDGRIAAALAVGSTPVAVLDRAGRVIFANIAFRQAIDELLGNADVDGDSLIERLCPASGDGRDVIAEALASGAWQGVIDRPRATSSSGGARVLLTRSASLPPTSLLLEIVRAGPPACAGPDSPASSTGCDDLTGLPTRSALFERLAQILRDPAGGRRAALLFIDLDGFKLVNDTLGHHVGDQLLRAVAQRLTARIRASDLAVRLGGDEFAILLDSIQAPADAGRVAADICSSLCEVVSIGENALSLSASVGIAIAPDDATDMELLLRLADAAMYRAKRSSGKGYQYYAAQSGGGPRRARTLESELRRALRENELAVHYQPIVRPATGAIAHCEALLRWRHPERGLLRPGGFLRTAEDAHLLVSIGEWVLDRVASDAAAIVANFGADIAISVNIDPKQWIAADLPALVDRALQAHSMPYDNLALEVVETHLIRDFDRARRVLETTRSRGARTLLDDFGSGHAALNYFIELPFDYVKIDRSIVAHCPRGMIGFSMIQAIKFLARQLRVGVIAEGVENRLQHTAMRTGGIELAQGFHYFPPMPLDQLLRLDRAT